MFLNIMEIGKNLVCLALYPTVLGIQYSKPLQNKFHLFGLEKYLQLKKCKHIADPISL